MTRGEAKSKASIRIRLFDAKGANKIIDEIYNDHEAQLKLVSDVYSTDKMHMYQELKAKDDEIKGLGCRLYHAEGYINDLHNNPKDKKFYDKKARSIVAMLFWEWRDIKDCTNRDCAEATFRKAYIMLKDTQ